MCLIADQRQLQQRSLTLRAFVQLLTQKRMTETTKLHSCSFYGCRLLVRGRTTTGNIFVEVWEMWEETVQEALINKTWVHIPRVRSKTNCIPRAKGLSCSSTDLQRNTKDQFAAPTVGLDDETNRRSDLSVTMMAEGWAQAVMSVTMKRNMRKGMSVLQVRSHFPDVAKPFSFK